MGRSPTGDASGDRRERVRQVYGQIEAQELDAIDEGLRLYPGL